MGLGALSLPHGLSLVTIADAPPAAWSGLFKPRSRLHIPYAARTKAERNLLGARLDAAVTLADDAVLLVAHGASCFATAWWARLSPKTYVSRVAGALFFQPVEEKGGVEGLLDTFASPRTALPFPSIVLGADSAQGEISVQIRTLAAGWGSAVVERGEASPLRRTRLAIERFTAAVVERDVQVAHRLIGAGSSASRPTLLRRRADPG
ncbi:alpha/beta hydrolase [Sphingomonas sp. M1-B02]|uniref:alpha/beta hydrolase n=1 Tax=Sphingomonas sp. M1-B02 TaxID=3114300 RepID=UPI0022405577|nr:alpha/beta hydrolase [Sphingomonas sp. S6-11]UZK66078.1 alpha/beta hydrolase [Sphingomonas sp. S6-11]